MMTMNRGQLVALTLGAWAIAAAGTVFCIVQIYRTAQLPEGDGTGMQWIILTPLALLLLFIVVPAAITGLRGVRLLRTSETTGPSRTLPSRGWLIALGLLALYFLLPFIVGPLLGIFESGP
jgi:hypothetical protein